MGKNTNNHKGTKNHEVSWVLYFEVEYSMCMQQLSKEDFSAGIFIGNLERRDFVLLGVCSYLEHGRHKVAWFLLSKNLTIDSILLSLPIVYLVIIFKGLNFSKAPPPFQKESKSC